ncbi:hypothetical protein [Methanosarcina horonobensis]|uniref:hypothetical protein n=1 Tax=Methanosarcina horonobensis TaxID=418008 RepID=UPI000A7830E4|nr:hypothetical protein [Methanosarcina horonobensis]
MEVEQPSLAELLNAIAGQEKIREPTLNIEESMARLAIRGLPYFKITESTSETPGGKKISETCMLKTPIRK